MAHVCTLAHTHAQSRTQRHKTHTYAHTEIKTDFKIGLSELTAVDAAYVLQCEILTD